MSLSFDLVAKGAISVIMFSYSFNVKYFILVVHLKVWKKNKRVKLVSLALFSKEKYESSNCLELWYGVNDDKS